MKHSGFALIEMLITMLIFIIVVLAVYDLFDQGNWLYLKAERRVNLQDNGRLALEQMERDIRMIGVGVPTAQQFGGTTFWTPSIFVGNVNKIGFFGDIDNRNSMLRADFTSTDATMNVHEADGVCGVGSPTPLVVIEKNKKWGRLNCSSGSGNTLNVTATGTFGPLAAGETEVTSPERVFYRLNGDFDNDGVCDSIAEPFCSLQRAEIYENSPVASEPGDDEFTTLATDVAEIKFQYYYVSDSGTEDYAVEMTPPLAGIQLNAVQKIRVNLRMRGRSSEGPGKYQDIYLTSDVLLRDASY